MTSFQNFFNFIKQKRTEVTNTIAKYELKYSLLSISLKMKQKLLKKNINRNAVIFKKLNVNDPCNILLWKEMYTQEKKYGNCQNKAYQMESASYFLDEEFKNHQKISNEKYCPEIGIINGIIEEKIKIIINLKLNLERFLIISPLRDSTNPNRKIIKIPENPEWANKIEQKCTAENSSIFYNFASKKYYLCILYSKCSKIFENSTTDEIFSNKKCKKEITLNVGIDGIYIIANNGFLIYSIENSSRIGKANLSNTNQEDELDLGDVGFHNTYLFQFGGFTDIALFSDAHTETIFVMYQLKNENTATLNEFICFPKLKLGKAWKLIFAKSSIAFCTINDYILYIGKQYKCQ